MPRRTFGQDALEIGDVCTLRGAIEDVLVNEKWVRRVVHNICIIREIKVIDKQILIGVAFKPVEGASLCDIASDGFMFKSGCYAQTCDLRLR